jgi:hypothetical protein
MPKIRIYKTNNEYPSVHVMVTDNPRYLAAGGMVVDDVEAAIEKLRAWLKQHFPVEL